MHHDLEPSLKAFNADILVLNIGSRNVNFNDPCSCTQRKWLIVLCKLDKITVAYGANHVDILFIIFKQNLKLSKIIRQLTFRIEKKIAMVLIFI